LFEALEERRRGWLGSQLRNGTVGLLLGVVGPMGLYLLGVGSSGLGHGSILPIALLLGYPIPWGGLVWPALGVIAAWRPSRVRSFLGCTMLAVNLVGVGYVVVGGGAGYRLAGDLKRAGVLTIAGVCWYVAMMVVGAGSLWGGGHSPQNELEPDQGAREW
jgi:hypothetical protein